MLCVILNELANLNLQWRIASVYKNWIPKAWKVLEETWKLIFILTDICIFILSTI